jgi:hypothetical protein
MTIVSMNNLDSLRNKFDSQQRDILAVIWRYYVKEGHWMPTRLLHVAGGGKKTVRPILEQFGGSVVYEQEENGILYYGLTFLGVLLSSEGEYVEKLLTEYLRIAQTLALQEPNRTHVCSEEALKHLRLTPDGVIELGRFLFLSPFLSSGSFGQNEWNTRLPKNIEDLPDDPRSLIHEAALANYDPNVPLPSYDRTAYYLAAKARPRDGIFTFVGNELLRKIATQDWAEAKLCFNAKAWKSCVIACGSVLEAVLLDALLQNPDGARIALSTQQPTRKLNKDLCRWNLVDLVDAATKLNIIGEASSHLGHALRLHRDLVHPGRQLKEPVVVIEEEAVISINTVEKCIRDLSASRQPKKYT